MVKLHKRRKRPKANTQFGMFCALCQFRTSAQDSEHIEASLILHFREQHNLEVEIRVNPAGRREVYAKGDVTADANQAGNG